MRGFILQRGFTLIELLIVVAIIAILAAIAVPNFLEAQVRSKVSRTYADMRSLATGLEAYYVDSNNYPPSRGGNVPNMTPAMQAIYSSYLPRLVHLTTPIAYITAVPEDVFAQSVVDAFAAANPSSSAANAYRIPYQTGPIARPLAFDYAARAREISASTTWSYISAFPGTVRWALRSVGPDGVPLALGSSSAVAYDPTNGTVSFGEIFYTGPGIGVDKPLQ